MSFRLFNNEATITPLELTVNKEFSSIRGRAISDFGKIPAKNEFFIYEQMDLDEGERCPYNELFESINFEPSNKKSSTHAKSFFTKLPTTKKFSLFDLKTQLTERGIRYGFQDVVISVLLQTRMGVQFGAGAEIQVLLTKSKQGFFRLNSDSATLKLNIINNKKVELFISKLLYCLNNLIVR
ncbi:MAG: hypothetical protein K2Q14_01305 [Gammaproteobacteria bacterium]|nr:hypothetical protein [Gammaproteobacteria bacterium]